MTLLDTDIFVDILRDYGPAVAWLELLHEEEILIPGFAVMELIQGCRDKASQKRVESILSRFEVAWPSEESCQSALKLFADVHLSVGIGILDVLIGQMAVDLRVVLATFNQKHYSQVPGLLTIQPYDKN